MVTQAACGPVRSTRPESYPAAQTDLSRCGTWIAVNASTRCGATRAQCGACICTEASLYPAQEMPLCGCGTWSWESAFTSWWDTWRRCAVFSTTDGLSSPEATTTW